MLGATLARRLEAHPEHGPCRVGVEHELQVWAPAGQQDFRLLIARVAGAVGVQHPGDPRARWLASGLALTADGWEAELITPPVPLRRSSPDALAAMLDVERHRLLNSLREVDQHARLVGFSTHVNVSVDDGAVVGVAREFASRCAVAAGLLLDGADSPGVLIRPRRGRLEICGEFATGEDLAASIVFVAAAAAMLGDPGATLPEVGNWRVVPARERFGFFVSRDATGSDLYRAGRRAPVSLPGRTVLAQHHLEGVWSLVRPHAVSLGLDPTPVDERVLGLVPLPVERARTGGEDAWMQDRSGATKKGQDANSQRLTLLDPVERTRLRGAVTLAPAWLTWSTVAWRCEDARQGVAVYAVMPVECEPGFLQQLDAGALDGLLSRSLRRRTRGRVLCSADKTRRPEFWRDVRPEALVPAERDHAGAIARFGAGSGSGDEAGTKDRYDESTPPSASSRAASPVGAAAANTKTSALLSRGLLIAATCVAALLGGGAVWAITGGNDDPNTARSTSTLGPTAPAGPAASARAIASPETEPTLQPPTVQPWSVSYVGTLDRGPGPGGGPEDGFQMGIFCPDDTGSDCNFTGFSVFGWDELSGIQLSGPGTYTAAYVDPAYNPCDAPREGSGPPTNVSITLDEESIRWVINSADTGLVDCGDGSQSQNGASSTSFEGTYVEGSLPGFAP